MNHSLNESHRVRPFLRAIKTKAVLKNMSDRPDAFFRLAGSRRLSIQPALDPLAAVDYLSRRIIQQPKDLRIHVQRINQLCVLTDEPKLFGALVDLFIVLSNAGEALKRRFLKQASPMLAAEHLDFLSSAVGEGLDPGDSMLAGVRGSVLKSGVEGVTLLVKKTAPASQAYQGPYDEAMACLEYGQLEEARRVLEIALSESDPDPRIPQQLMEIYRHAQDADAMQAIQQWLQDSKSIVIPIK